MHKIFWGDIHNHNGIGYGTGSLERSYEIAKGSLLDFYAFTPHGHWPDAPGEDEKIRAYHREGYRKVSRAWPEVSATADKHNVDEKFTVLKAFEWHSSGSGDYCVYLSGGGEVFAAEDLAALKEYAAEHNALLIPHHIGYREGARGLAWEGFDEKYSPVVEAFSEHGCSVEPGTAWPMAGHSMGGLERSRTVFSKLNEGKFFGITASTDNHFGHPASAGEGLTGLYMDELSRESVFRAIRARRSLCATGERIDAFFRLGDAFAGDIAEPRGDGVFEYSAAGFGEIEYVRIIKNGAVVHTHTPAGDEDRSEFVARVEFGWGGMKADDITCFEFEVSADGGEFTGVSPGFCGGADSEKLNRITELTPSSIKFEAFTSRRNTRPVSYVAFRCSGESAVISVNCRMVCRDKVFKGSAAASAAGLAGRDTWINPAGEFSSPVVKLGGYAGSNMFRAAGSWRDGGMESGDWYMLKVLQKNGHAAWTSPIKIA